MAKVMFRTYGLFWREEHILWGRGEHLKGQEVNADTGKPTSGNPVDFKDQIGIYALYYDFELVYVGQVGAKKVDPGRGANLLTRLKDHKDGRNSERWDRFSWFGLRGVTQSGKLTKLRKGPLAGVTRSQILKQFEGVMIALSEPRLNLQRGHWKGYATQYSQWYDPRLEDE